MLGVSEQYLRRTNDTDHERRGLLRQSVDERDMVSFFLDVMRSRSLLLETARMCDGMSLWVFRYVGST